MESDIFLLKMRCPFPPTLSFFHTLTTTVKIPIRPTINTPQFCIGVLKNTRTIASNRPNLSNALNLTQTVWINDTISNTELQTLQPPPNPFSVHPKQILRRLSSDLQTCVSNNSLIDGKIVHGYIIKSCVCPDSYLWSSLANMYAKCGSIFYACQVFDKMPQRDVVVWTTLISGLVAAGNAVEGLVLFCKMLREGILPNGFSLATCLKACSMCLAIDFGEQVHGTVVKTGFLSDIFVGSALVDVYAKCGAMELAKRVFMHMPEQNAVSWNALLSGYVQIGDEERVLELFLQMTELEVKLSKFTLSSVLKGCASLKALREGRLVHSLAVKTGCEFDAFLSSSLIDMYSKCGLVEDAYKVFVGTADRDVVSWSTMIACFDQQGFSSEAANVFSDMRRTNIRPNQFTLASLVSVATDIADINYGHSLHAYITKAGFESDNSVGNALVMMYMKIGTIQDGCRMFENITERDLVSWNALLSGFHNESSNCEEGLRIFNQMLTRHVMPNKYTFISVIRSCTNLLALDDGEQVHAHIVKNGLEEDSFIGTSLVDMYAKCGLLDKSCQIFDRLPKRDVFTWTVIISGFAQTHQGEKAINCCRQMLGSDVRGNEFTFASSLRACSSIGALQNGQQFHSLVVKAGHLNDMVVGSALVDMYGKCGCIDDAEAAFDGLVSRDVVSWNTIICGYSQHVHGEKALEAFECMLDEGLRPDEVTFIGVLSACSHVGLIEEGRKHFDSLSPVYGITPTIEHHACMVNILGRAGKLNEVESFIEKMPLTPNGLIWQVVLGACRMHGNVEFGEKAAKQLFELEPQMDSTYILLSNIYAASGQWDDVLKVRKMMVERGVKKEPGCSWIEIDGQFHIFIPHDGSHQHAKEIYLKLEELKQQLNLAGYVPDTNLVLHNVSNDEKMESLHYHSERLALAYGLICTGSGKVIRIFKNLRICGDCHKAIKLISDFTSREIIIRDVSRFHHFKNGSCSCGDYW